MININWLSLMFRTDSIPMWLTLLLSLSAMKSCRLSWSSLLAYQTPRYSCLQAAVPALINHWAIFSFIRQILFVTKSHVQSVVHLNIDLKWNEINLNTINERCYPKVKNVIAQPFFFFFFFLNKPPKIRTQFKHTLRWSCSSLGIKFSFGHLTS